jgi:hypothetical protein
MIGIKGYQKGHTTCLETRNKIGDALRTSFYVPCAYCKNSVLTKPSHFRKITKTVCTKEAKMSNDFFFDRAELEYENQIPKEDSEHEYIKEIIKHTKCKNTKEENHEI